MEVQEVLKAVGLPEDIGTIEKIVEKHNSLFLPLADAHTDERVVEKITGKIFGGLTTAAKRQFGLTNEEIKDKKFEDIMAMGTEKLSKKIKDLESTGSDEKVKNLTSELEKVKGQSQQYQTELEKVVKEKGDLETSFNTKLKEHKISGIVKEAKGKLSFADGVPEVARLGFDSLVASKYKIDLDEKENPIVTDLEGKRIKNPTKSGAFLSIDEVLDQELDGAKLKKKNNLPGNKPFQFTPNPASTEPPATGRKVHPAALKAAERAAAR